MAIHILFRYRRSIICGLLPLLCAMLFASPVLAARRVERPEATPTMVKWNVRENMIIIHYDLNTNPTVKCRVDVRMRSETDSSFSAVPLAVQGDVGEGYFAGSNREIRWDYRRDYPDGLDEENYFFEIHIQEEEQSDGNGWLSFAIGAVAVAGGVLAFVISKNQPDLPSSAK